MGIRGVRRRLWRWSWDGRWGWWALMGILGVRSYEGLPPEVGAFNFQKWVHAPWPVHNFARFCHFCDDFGRLGVGVIPGLVDGFGWRRARGLIEEEGYA